MEHVITNPRIFNRREFTVAAALAALSGVAITISACGGSGSGSPAAPSSTSATGDKTAAIGDNHGHTAVITSAQLTAGGALSLSIRGTSDHPHTVTLTAADVTAIAASGRVSRQSTADAGHSHSVTFN